MNEYKQIIQKTRFKADCGAVAEIDKIVDADVIRTYCPKCDCWHEFGKFQQEN